MSAFDLGNIPPQDGRAAIVTGANIGLGYETTAALAAKGVQVTMACRNLDKAEKAREQILKAVPNGKLKVMELDLSRMESVRSFASNFKAQHHQLDLLINNAGVMMPPFSLTEDGFELQMATNYFGHFLLTGLLLDLVMESKNSRVVSLSSNAHKFGAINLEDLQSKQKYSKSKAYAQSKLACLMFAFELQRRLEKTGSDSLSVAAHPGVSSTNLGQYLPKAVMFFEPVLAPLLTQKPKAGAEPTLYAALGTDVNGGEYFGPKGWGEWRGRAKKVDSTPLSKDQNLAGQLWEASEELVGLKYL